MNEAPDPQAGYQPARQIQITLPVLAPKVTYAILGFTVFIYILQFLSRGFVGYDFNGLDILEHYAARSNDAIRAGQLWRFITPVFLHASPTHIFFNMYALFSIGSFLERQFGHTRLALLYFLCAFSGNVFSFLLSDGYSVGASTAVFGLITAEAVFFYQNRELFGNQARQALGNAAFIIIINLVIGLSPGIDNWGHVGGLLGGAMFAWFASPRWEVVGIPPALHLEDQRELREIVLGASLVLILFGALAIWGMFF
jgi:rhomboid protease GluP